MPSTQTAQVVTLECWHCGQHFQRPSRLVRSERTFCSPQCRDAGHQATKVGSNKVCRSCKGTTANRSRVCGKCLRTLAVHTANFRRVCCLCEALITRGEAHAVAASTVCRECCKKHRLGVYFEATTGGNDA